MSLRSCFGTSICWRSWGSEAIREALDSDKPLWVTIFDEESPWSGAMEKSFNDDEAVQLLNDDFVPLLCHAEDHADVAYLGQTLCGLFGTPGWPVNMVLTPRLEPVFAASWLAFEARGATPTLLDVVRRIKWLWVMKRPEIDQACQIWQQRLSETLSSRSGEPSAHWENLAQRAVLGDADQTSGGYGGAPKFPQWWRLMVASGSEAEQGQLERSLTAMTCGALQDHVNGGFHRYCRDDQWRVPLVGRHLDVQALAALTLMKGWRRTGSPLYQRAAMKCFDAMKDLTPQGELPRRGEAPWGMEQSWRRSLWSPEEVASILGDDASWYCDVMSITEGGSWFHPVSGQATGLSAPALGDPGSVAEAQGWSLSGLLQRLDRAQSRLKAHRQEQSSVLQDHVTASSVGVSALALARGGRLFDMPSLLVQSAQMMEQLQEQLMNDEVLLHGLRKGQPWGSSTLADWAACAAAGLELAVGFSDSLWLGWAEKMVCQGWQRFGGDKGLKLFCSSEEKLLECSDASDGTSFSAPALMALTMNGLAHCLNEETWRDRARKVLSFSGASVVAAPTSHAGLLSLWRSLEDPHNDQFF